MRVDRAFGRDCERLPPSCPPGPDGQAGKGSCVREERQRGRRTETIDDLDDPNRVWPTGLTIKESEALHKHVIDGSRVFFVIAVFAHMLAYIYSPWLK